MSEGSAVTSATGERLPIPDHRDNGALDDTQHLVHPVGGLSSRQFLIFLICGAGMFFNAFAQAMTMVFGTVFRPSEDITASAIGLLLGAGALGSALGSPLLGQMADRLGRVGTMILTLVASGLFSILCAVVVGIEMLTLARLASSVFLGAYFPIVATYLVEILPKGNATRYLQLIGVIAGIGMAAALLLTAVLTDHPILGLSPWRCSMWFMGLGTFLIAGATWAFVHESPSWLRSRGLGAKAALIETSLGMAAATAALEDAADRGAAREKQTLLAPALRSRLMLIIALQFFAAWSVMFMSLQGALFSGTGATQGQSEALYSAGKASLPICLGSLVMAYLVGYVREVRLIAIIAAAMAAFALAFAASTDKTLLVILAGGFNMIIGSYFNLLMVYSANRFPAATRARATSVVTMTLSIVSAVAPLMGLQLIAAHLAWMVLWIVAAAQIGVMALMLIFGERFMAPPDPRS